MKYEAGIARILPITLLVAALILPVGVNKQVMAYKDDIAKDNIIFRGNEMAGCEEEDYSVSGIKFLTGFK